MTPEADCIYSHKELLNLFFDILSPYDKVEVQRILVAIRAVQQITGRAFDVSTYRYIYAVLLQKYGQAASDFTALESFFKGRKSRVVTFAEQPRLVIGADKDLWLTLPQVLNLVNLRRMAGRGYIALFIESNVRTETFKPGRRTLNSDEQRRDMIMRSGLVDFVGVGRGNGYRNPNYRSLIMQVAPNYYAVGEDLNPKMKEEAAERARLVDAKLVIMKEYPGLHTTDLENLYIPTEKGPAVPPGGGMDY
jgi:hypothetical protein